MKLINLLTITSFSFEKFFGQMLRGFHFKSGQHHQKLKEIIHMTFSKVQSLYSGIDSSRLQKKEEGVEMIEQDINHFGILAP